MGLRILQLSTSDVGGGAEQVAMNLHQGFRAAGDDAVLAVGLKRGTEPGVEVIDNAAARGAVASRFEHLASAVVRNLKPNARVSALLCAAPLLVQPRRLRAFFAGEEDFEMPASRRLLDLAPARLDVLHAHNLHGGYFDLRELATLSARVPTFLTLHDMWTLTGHCAYSLGCERWRVGCGACPDLAIYPAIRRDATARNLARKKGIFASSQLRVAAPSRWLLEKARASVLAEGVVEWRLIPYGVDLETFHPESRGAARARVGIPDGARMLLYVANVGRSNPFKDYTTAAEAVSRVAEADKDGRVVFVVLGSKGDPGADPRVRFVPYVNDRKTLADYYRSADLFLHAAIEDNFPNTVLEAQACGTPVVATAVGGIAEQIEHGVTGFLVPGRGAAEMAEAVLAALRDEGRLAHMRERAASRARERYALERHVGDYRRWFSEVCLEHGHGDERAGA